MERLYEIENEYIKIILNADIYPVVVIEKTVSSFLDRAVIKLEKKNAEIIVKFILNDNENIDISNIIVEFYNKLLEESLRYNISRETKELRELIVARALYSTCIEIDNAENKDKINKDESLESGQKDYTLEEIAVNWFEKNTDKEEK